MSDTTQKRTHKLLLGKLMFIFICMSIVSSVISYLLGLSINVLEMINMYIVTNPHTFPIYQEIIVLFVVMLLFNIVCYTLYRCLKILWNYLFQEIVDVDVDEDTNTPIPVLENKKRD